MDENQVKLLEELRKGEIAQTDRWLQYWQDYSHVGTWQFWVVLTMLLLPLIILILFIDRNKIFQLGFFGYSVHLSMAVLDSIGVLKGTWMYPYKIYPVLPSNISLDSSLVPVSFILVYQYTINKGKNYYLWALLLCLAFSFFLKPLLLGFGLFRFGGNENFLILLGGYAVIALYSKWITDIFLYLLKTKKWSLYHK
ncbi:CBO0543 family protein [Metabacillus malikii]|uniref:Uncharacterized protein n=1 Tax=Metabacillus malikii TaxID=1504265 RepID=A0ABT9ZDV0_9BACI|nr:CBO0543 family protein [Metabacillus malikii]MDQ0230119.1 hypothetical protein [Metabacillus malikii]